MNNMKILLIVLLSDVSDHSDLSCVHCYSIRRLADVADEWSRNDIHLHGVALDPLILETHIVYHARVLTGASLVSGESAGAEHEK
jgi:hypothetical protein